MHSTRMANPSTHHQPHLFSTIVAKTSPLHRVSRISIRGSILRCLTSHKSVVHSPHPPVEAQNIVVDGGSRFGGSCSSPTLDCYPQLSPSGLVFHFGFAPCALIVVLTKCPNAREHNGTTLLAKIRLLSRPRLLMTGPTSTFCSSSSTARPGRCAAMRLLLLLLLSLHRGTTHCQCPGATPHPFQRHVSRLSGRRDLVLHLTLRDWLQLKHMMP